MKILITGVNGFLGEELSKFFLTKKNFKIIGSDISPKKNTKFSFIKCDLTKDFEILENNIKEIKPDAIIHCAAKIFEERNKQKIWELNYYSTKKLYDLSKKYKKVKKFIFISTFFIFEKNYNYFVSENEKPSCINEYGKSKVASENYIKKRKKYKILYLKCPIIMSKKYRISILSDLIKDNFNIQ